MNRVIVTGGAGFLGRLLVERLLGDGYGVTSIDLQPNDRQHRALKNVVGDIRNRADMYEAFAGEPIDTVFHCAAQLAHGSMDSKFLWSCNVDGTASVAEFAEHYRIPKVVYLSSNCLWGDPLGRPVREDDAPKPVEVYGLSKWKGEEILQAKSEIFNTVILRCPTIMDAGRLGLLSILFEFIQENRRIWVVGNGENRYQFIYAQDLIDAMLLSAKHPGADLFGVGSDDPRSLRQIYQHVIDLTDSRSRVSELPKSPTLAIMRLAYHLRISPLGPYHYKMIAEDFCFDTSKIKGTLGWQPKLTNEEMLLKAYQYFDTNKREIFSRSQASSHRKPAKMGVIRLLKWAS